MRVLEAVIVCRQLAWRKFSETMGAGINRSNIAKRSSSSLCWSVCNSDDITFTHWNVLHNNAG